MKLYLVSIYDTEDGGHLLAESFFLNAKDAREEFKQVIAKMFEGYYYDQPDEYGYRHDSHFTCYKTDNYEITLSVKKANEHLNHYLLDDVSKEPYCRPINPKESKYAYNPTIGSIFDTAVDGISYSRFNDGFKIIYKDVKRCLFDSFVKCEYIKNNKGKRRMRYYVKPEDAGPITIVVCRNENKMKYTWHFEEE